jgi:hypothetical protein
MSADDGEDAKPGNLFQIGDFARRERRPLPQPVKGRINTITSQDSMRGELANYQARLERETKQSIAALASEEDAGEGNIIDLVSRKKSPPDEPGPSR